MGIQSHLLRCLYFACRSLVGIILPIFVLFPTRAYYYSEAQGTIANLYFEGFQSVGDVHVMVMCWLCFGLILVEKVSYLSRRLRVNVLLVMVLNLLTPMLNPIFIQMAKTLSHEDETWERLMKGIAIINILCLVNAAVFYEVFIFTFSFNPKNKLCKVKNTSITIRETLVILLSLLLPAVGNTNPPISIVIQLIYWVLPLITICTYSPI